MSDVVVILEKLKEEGFSLWLDGEKLRYKAPKESITKANLLTLKRNKEEIIQVLQNYSKRIVVEVDSDNRYEPFPLTDVQTAYLMGRNNLFDYGGVACHVYLELKYKKLDVSRVRLVWNKLIQTHDMLRTVVFEEGYQQVLKEVPELEIPYWDVSKGENICEYNDFRQQMGNHVYDTGKWPMFGIAVAKKAEESILYFSMDFLIADWTSIWMLLSEFEALYYLKKDSINVPQITFRDYLSAERKLKESERYVNDKRYWEKRIAYLPDAPELPTLSAEDVKKNFTRKLLCLDSERWNSFKDAAKKLGITPSTAILTAYSDVIAKWSYNKSFCINLTVLNRFPLHDDVTDIVGDFTTLNLLEINANDGNNFAERARKINERLFIDLDHRLFGGVEVIRELSKQRNKRVFMPIVYTSAIGLADQNRQITGKFDGGITQTPQVFIDCQAMDGDFGLQINWDVREGVFPDGMIDDMFDLFQQRIEELAKDETDWNKINGLFLPQWQADERNVANHTETDLPIHLLQSGFMEWAQKAPDRVAVTDGEKKLTYGELHQYALKIRQKIVNVGAKHQDCIAIAMNKSIYQVAAVLGTLYAGCIYVPIVADQEIERAKKILEITNANIVLTTVAENSEYIKDAIAVVSKEKNEILAMVEPASITSEMVLEREKFCQELFDTVLSYDEHYFMEFDQEKVQLAVDSRNEAAAYSLLYGLQKMGILLKNKPILMEEILNDSVIPDKYRWLTVPWLKALLKSGLIRKRNDGKFEAIENVEWSQKEQQWNVAFDKWYDKLGNVSTLEYIKLNADEFANIMSGKTDPVSLLYPDGSNKYTQALYVENTATKYINASICKIIKKVQKRVPGQKIKILEVGAGTGATTEWVFKALEGSEFEYCFTDISKYFFPDAVNRFGKNPNVTIKKLDLNEDFVAQGFCPNSYDVIIGAYVLNNVKDIVKTINKLKELVRNEGYLIFSETILPETWLLVSQALMMTPPEDTLRDGAAFISKDLWCGVLKESDGVEESVLSIPSNNNPTSLLGAGLFIKQFKRTDAFLDKMEINRRLEKYLPAYMLPSEICIIDRIPLSANGKIDRKAVEDWFERYRISEDKISEKEETKTDLEKMICQIWCEALDIGDLGRKENFYDYGADSLIMAQVTTKVRSKLEKEIPFDALLRQMLNTPTIEEIALYISAYDNQEIESPMCEKKFEYIAKNGERNGNRGRILLHGALGSVDVYRYLIPEMEKQNCGEIISIGISDLDEYCKLESEEVVLHLADLYTQKILEENLDKVQIVGYSFSGVIAIEMAKQLLEAGIDVEDVAIIDGCSIPVEIQDEIIYELFFIGNLHVSLEKLKFTDLKVFEKIFGKIVDSKQDSISISDFEDSQEDCHIYERLLELSQLTQEARFKTYLSVSDDSSVRNLNFDMVKHLYTIFKKSFAALRFVPTVYFGDIRYFKTTERNGIFKYFEALLQEWDDVCIGDFETIEIAGNHYSCLENPNNAHELAKKLGSVYKEWREE